MCRRRCQQVGVWNVISGNLTLSVDSDEDADSYMVWLWDGDER